MANTLGMSGFSSRSTSSAALPVSAKGFPQSSVNLSHVAHETQRVSLRHSALAATLAIDGQHLNQATDELRDVREQIRAVTARMTRNQRAIDAYESDCVPLVAAYKASLSGMKATLERCSAGHAKSASGVGGWVGGWVCAALLQAAAGSIGGAPCASLISLPSLPPFPPPFSPQTLRCSRRSFPTTPTFLGRAHRNSGACPTDQASEKSRVCH
jgi:hypothetical protein